MNKKCCLKRCFTSSKVISWSSLKLCARIDAPPSFSMKEFSHVLSQFVNIPDTFFSLECALRTLPLEILPLNLEWKTNRLCRQDAFGSNEVQERPISLYDAACWRKKRLALCRRAHQKFRPDVISASFLRPQFLIHESRHSRCRQTRKYRTQEPASYPFSQDKRRAASTAQKNTHETGDTKIKMGRRGLSAHEI